MCGSMCGGSMQCMVVEACVVAACVVAACVRHHVWWQHAVFGGGSMCGGSMQCLVVAACVVAVAASPRVAAGDSGSIPPFQPGRAAAASSGHQAPATWPSQPLAATGHCCHPVSAATSSGQVLPPQWLAGDTRGRLK